MSEIDNKIVGILVSHFEPKNHYLLTDELVRELSANKAKAVASTVVAELTKLKGEFRMGRAGENPDPYAAKIIDQAIKHWEGSK